MATIYNLTNVTNSTNLYEFALASNQISGGVAGTVILTVMYFITFTALKGWSNKDAFASTSFAFSVLGTLFFLSGLIPEVVYYIYLALMVFSLGMLLIAD